jgi:predicted enzyme related to lactoylglutathione lyase
VLVENARYLPCFLLPRNEHKDYESSILDDDLDFMRIKYTSVYVRDQGEALNFYTKTLGFIKKADISAGNYRWLTVASPEDPDGTQLVLEPNQNPAAKAYQEALYTQGGRAAMFLVDDVKKEYERLKQIGVKFTMGPTELPGVGSIIAVFDDTCGNLIQITRLQG